MLNDRQIKNPQLKRKPSMAAFSSIRRKAVWLATAIIFCFSAATAQAAPGDLDPTWGNGGITVSSLGTEETQEVAYFLHIQPDGKLIVSGYDNGNLAAAPFVSFIARFNANGTLDTSFGTNGKINSLVGSGEYYYATALQSDGKIVAAGYKRIGGDSDFAVARYNSDGTLDATFGTNGKVITPVGSSVDEVGDMLLQPDGKIVVVGYSFVSNSGYDFSIVRYNLNGSLDASFGTGGKVIIDIPSGSDVVTTTTVSSVLQPDGKIVIGGTGGVTNTDFVLARLQSNGSLDSTFGTGGRVVTALSANNDEMYDIALQPDGKIIAAGNANQINGMDFDTALVRYNPNGSLDTTFAQNGVLRVQWSSRYYVGNGVAVQSNGKILAFGFGFVGTSNSMGFATARYNADGSPDATFGTNGRVITKIGNNDSSFAFEGAVQPDGKILTYGSTNGDTAIVRNLGDSAQRPAQFDFDGDGRADVSVFRPSNGFWYLLNSANNSFAAAQWGAANDRLAPADFDGDRKTDFAVFRNGSWFILQSTNNSLRTIQFGQTGDVPVPGDYDGDGQADAAVFRNGNWYILNSANNTFRAEQFGLISDKPIVGDFDGDGRQDLAVFRDGNWFAQRSTAGFFAQQFGASADKPVAADYDGDGRTDLAVFRAGNWFIQQSSNNQFRSVQFGISSDKLVPADYDGDGRADAAVYRDGTWYLLRSTQGFAAVQFGASADSPVPSAFLP